MPNPDVDGDALYQAALMAAKADPQETVDGNALYADVQRVAATDAAPTPAAEPDEVDLRERRG